MPFIFEFGAFEDSSPPRIEANLLNEVRAFFLEKTLELMERPRNIEAVAIECKRESITTKNKGEYMVQQSRFCNRILAKIMFRYLRRI